MSGNRSSSMDVNLGLASRGAPRVSSSEARRLQDERLQRYSADDGNNLLPRLWDRAGAQYYTGQGQQQQQYNGGQAGDRPN